jgi:hypothetical protein
MMNQADIFKKIGLILNELQDQYEFLAKNPEQLSELELELFLANANFLSDHVQIVKKINSQKPLIELPQHTEKVVKEPVISTPREELFTPVEVKQSIPDSETKTFEFLLSEPEPTDKFEFEEEKPLNEIFDRPLSEEEAQIIERKQKEVTRQPEETGPEPFLMPQQEAKIEEKPSNPIYTSYTEVIPDKVEEKEVAPIPTKALELDKPEEKLVAPKQTLNEMLAGKNSLNNVNEDNTKPAIKDLKLKSKAALY